MIIRLLIVAVLLSIVSCSAYSQYDDDNTFWIVVSDSGAYSSTMWYGDRLYATYCVDDGTNGTANYFELFAPPPPPDGLDTRWEGVRGPDGDSCFLDGLFPRDYRTYPFGPVRKDTFKISFKDLDYPDSAIYFSWPDAYDLLLRCDSMYFQYTDPDSTPTTIKVNMITQSSLKIPSAGTRNIGWAYIYKFGFAMDGVDERETVFPKIFSLAQAFPNPFNSRTRISYSIATRSHVSLKSFDLQAREIAVLVDEDKSPGNYSVVWDPTGVASGVYFYKMIAGNFIEIKKVQLLK